MTVRRLALACCIVVCCASVVSADVLQRYTIVVGANDGGADRPRLRYAVSDAERFGRVLVELGGVQPANEILLREPTAQALHDALTMLAARIARERPRAAAGRTEVLFYYSGHADEQGLLLGGDRVSYRALRDRLDAVPADVRIAVLDACASGAFTRLKGGKSRPAFFVDASTSMRGHAFLTSSAATEAAQESDRIKASYFTHYLVSAFRGAADSSGDGRVTLNEAYQFAFAETVGRTAGTAAGAQHPSYDISLTGAGDVVMTDVAQTTATLELGPDVEGRLYVRSASQALVAELSKGRGRRVALGLEPGTYEVRLDDDRSSRRTRIVLDEGGRVSLGGAQFAAVAREATRERGEAVAGRYPIDGATRVSMQIGGWGTHGRALRGVGGGSLDIAGGGEVVRHVSDTIAVSIGLHAYGAERVRAFLGGFALPLGARWYPRPGDTSQQRVKPYAEMGLLAVARTSVVAADRSPYGGGVGYGLGARLGVGADVHVTPRWAVGATVGYHAFPFTDQGPARDDYRGRQVAVNVSWLLATGR
ncbi:MAG: caspase domain-containing protein [Vicinamibacterales bacterium]